MNKKLMYSSSFDNSSWYDNIQDATDHYDLAEYLNGKLLIAYRGVYKEPTHEDFIADLGDTVKVHIQNTAAHNSDGVSYDCNYLEDITGEKEKDLENHIIEWLNKNCPQPSFYTVDDIQEIKVRVRQIGKDIEYEVIEE